jgi:CPA2 family monovalent cation:H+ antiporter-2
MAAESVDLREAVVFLTAAGLIVPVAEKIKVNKVLAFLLVGVLIGPYGLGRLAASYPVLDNFLITSTEGVAALAELGVIFLLFMIGLELSVGRLWAMRRLVFGLGAAQVVLCSIVIGVVALLFGNSPEASIVLGACLALSSTAVVMEMLSERRALGTPTGRTSFSILLFQDVAVIPILFLVGALATFQNMPNGSSSITVWAALGLALLQAGLAVGVIYGLGRLAVPRLFKLVGARKNADLFIAATLLVIAAASMAASAAGLSLALGAFLAGLLFAETPYRHTIEADIAPFKGLLLGLFFLSVGMNINIAAVIDTPLRIAISVVGLFVIKGIIIYGLARLFGVTRPASAESAILLGQGGEFAFVVIGLAISIGLLEQPIAQFMLIVVSITLIVTPFAARLAQAVAARLTDGLQKSQPTGDLADMHGARDHVLIVGYGRVGQMLAELLSTPETGHIGLDVDIGHVNKGRAIGAPVYFGDGSRPDILKSAGVREAAIVAVTLNNAIQAAEVVEAVRALAPDVAILARARDGAHAMTLRQKGANIVIPETLEAGLQLGQAMLMELGMPFEAANQVIAERRQREMAELGAEDISEVLTRKTGNT